MRLLYVAKMIWSSATTVSLSIDVPPIFRKKLLHGSESLTFLMIWDAARQSLAARLLCFTRRAALGAWPTSQAMEETHGSATFLLAKGTGTILSPSVATKVLSFASAVSRYSPGRRAVWVCEKCSAVVILSSSLAFQCVETY